MYDCEGVVTNDPKINEIYYKYVQEQMIRALDNATEYLTIIFETKSKGRIQYEKGIDRYLTDYRICRSTLMDTSTL